MRPHPESTRPLVLSLPRSARTRLPGPLIAVALAGIALAAPAAARSTAPAPSGASPSSQDTAAPVDAFTALRDSLAESLVPQLMELAEQCRAEKLYGTADKVKTAVLGLDPYHAAARRALGYFDRGDEGWVRSRTYRVRRNYGEPETVEAMQSRIDELMQVARTPLLELVAITRAERGLSKSWRQLERLGDMFPEDATIHELLGEERVEDHWELVESVRARSRRQAYPNLARACLERAPDPVPGEVRPEERKLNLQWNSTRRTEDVRVLATTSDADAVYAARVSHAIGDFVRYALRVDAQHRDDFTIYMLGLQDRGALLQAWPQLSVSTRKALMQADGGWLDAQNRLAQWSANPARRIDGAARQTFGTMLIDSFGIDGRQAWAWEGLGLYLVHEMVGTRLTWFFHPEGYAPQAPTGLWQRLQNPEVDWFREAATMLDAPQAPRLVSLLGRKVNAMREQDVLHAYVFAAYLLEGHPQALPKILKRIGAGERPAGVLEEELGYPMPVVEKRLRRWIDESR